MHHLTRAPEHSALEGKLDQTMDRAIETGVFELLLRPIAGEAPAGEDLRLDISPQSLYFRLRDARAEASAVERQADNDPAAGSAMPAQWNIIHDLCIEALSRRTKDIEIACWLTESLARRHGVAGLIDSTELLIGLIKQYWDHGLYPVADDQSAEDRLIAITGLSGQDRDGSLLPPLRKQVLFCRADGAPVAFWEYERSRELAALVDPAEKHAPAAKNVAAFGELDADARGLGRDSLIALGQVVTMALASWRRLEEVVSRVAKGDAVPATGRVRLSLERLSFLVERYVPTGISAPPQEDGATTTTPGGSAEPAWRHRDALLDDLLRIAASFRANEPNSPLSFTLDEAVRRARMSWPDLLRELLPDAAARAAVLSGAGVRPMPE